jgi:lipopolysaccharide export LptBFGC system permease protein LptF
MRIPSTIWRFITLDLTRLVLVTSIGFVFVLSFAATVKFFAEGKLSLADMLLFMVLAIPPMLYYALPFAAGFAATLSYHRFEQDNERIAAHAGGVSHAALLAPALVTGIVLTTLMWVNTDEIAPRFLRSMEELVFTRAGKVIVNTIENGEPIVYNEWMIHADAVHQLSQEHVEEVNAEEGFALLGVVAVKTDDRGDVELETTASVAWVYLLRSTTDVAGESNTTIAMQLDNATTWTRDSNNFDLRTANLRWQIPETFSDSPKYLTRSELAAARRDPDRLNVISTRRRDLAYHYAERLVKQRIDDDLESDAHSTTLVDRDGRAFILHGAGLRWRNPGYAVLPGEDGIALDRVDADGRVVRMAADDATLFITIGEDFQTRDLNIRIELEQPRSTELDESGAPVGAAGGRTELVRDHLGLPDDPLGRLLELDSEELMALIAPHLEANPDDDYVANAYAFLRDRIDELMREIASKQQERIAMSVSCLVMVLSGSIVALRLGRGQPLTAYLWSFFPGILAIVTISVGQQVGHGAGLIGFVLLWAGLAGLGLYALIAFVGLIRH